MNARSTIGLGARRRMRRASWSLIALAAAVATLPGAAVADQASQPTSAAAGSIAAGSFHSCAVNSGAVRCWGYGGNGQLGYGTTTSVGDDDQPDAFGPVDLGAGRTAKAVDTGHVHTCALLDDNTVRCWGFGANGELGYANRTTIGDDESPGSVGPVDLGAGRTARAIATGSGHTCALLDNGTVRCWGFGLDGRLGYGAVDNVGDTETPGSMAPVNLGAGRTAKAISAGGFHTCALLDDGTVNCWGFGGNGRLGYGKVADVGRTPDRTPDTSGTVELGAGRTAKAISAGFGHTCAILDNSSVRCWGFAGSGRLGYGNLLNIGDDELPAMTGTVDLGPGRTAKAIHGGTEHTCVVLDDNSVKCWGFGAFGQLGYGTDTSVGDDETPSAVSAVDLGAGRGATAISAGALHTCARLDDESVRCWGYGANGRLGYCRETTIGDDERPGSVGPVPLGMPGIAGGGCPVIAPPPPPPGGDGGGAVVTVDPPGPPATNPPPAADPLAAALAAQDARAAALLSCLRGITRQVNAARRRARLFPRSRRRVALLVAERRGDRQRRICARRYARIPGRVTTLTARATRGRTIQLSFRTVGTDGSKAPGAHTYLVKQSTRPIRTARDFARAPSLCRGRCSFRITAVGANATLTITNLRRNRFYYYAIAARDNVSGRTGPRSRTIRALVR